MHTPYRAISGSYRRTIVVGDIHGCWDEFQRLLELARFGTEDLLLTVGDFLDRGSDSWSVARFFRSTSNAFSVIGNHERRVAGVIRGRSHPAWSQKQTLSLLSEGEREGCAGWLESLPAVIETPDVIVTHARLDPARPLSDQDSHFTAAVGGSSVKIDLDAAGVPLWFGQMRFDKPVCMGHIGYDRVALVPDGLYALDTRAVYAGQLTAVIFPDGDVLQVPAARNYHQESYKAWRMASLALAGDPMSWTLSQALKVLNAREGDQAEFADEIKALKGAISALGIEERGRRLRIVLHQRFGSIPDPGQERGAYFRAVKAVFPDWGSQNLAVRLLKAESIEFKDVAIALPSTRMCDVAQAMEKLHDDFLQPVRPPVGGDHTAELR